MCAHQSRNKPMPTRMKLKPPQALIYAMITIAAVDRSISDVELKRIGSMVTELPAFSGYGGDWLMDEAQAAGRLLSKPPNGVDTVLAMIKDSLPVELHETCYMLCAEVAASDLEVGEEEMRFLERLSDALEIDELVCVALERGARARHQRA